MSKKKVGLYPTGDNLRIRKMRVIITEIKEDAFAYNFSEAKGIIPFSRFISEEECSKVQINSEVTIIRYFNASGKRVLAYHARLES